MILWVGKYQTGKLWSVVVLTLADKKPTMSLMEGLTHDEACEYVKYFRGQRLSDPRQPPEQKPA